MDEQRLGREALLMLEFHHPLLADYDHEREMRGTAVKLIADTRFSSSFLPGEFIMVGNRNQFPE